MTRTALSSVAAAGSAALLLAVLGFQYLGGLAPCHLCVLQRWPHLAAVLIGLAMLRVRGALLPLLGAAAALTTAGIGLYHTAVERGWVAGPDSCTAGDFAALSPEALRARLEGTDLILCNQVAWEWLGLSMASWNALLSLALALVWLAAASRSRSAAV